MSGYIQAEITAEAVIGAMNEDGEFALEVWREIADGLHKGLLLDNALDLFATMSAHERAFTAAQLRTLAALAHDPSEAETPDA